PDLCSEPDLARLRDATVTARLVPEARVVRRGLELDVVTEICGQDGSLIFRQTFTMLQFGQTQEGTNDQNRASVAESSLRHAGSLTVDHDVPSNWAHICKDYNPIHMSDLVAKLFGFPGKLAHGNHVVAMALQTIGMRTDGGKTPLSMKVGFRRPVVVPAKLDIRVGGHGAVQSYELLLGSKTAIEGSFGPVQT
ncbi:hypothetical protein LTS18_009226, partial [Coniosporium uncinatum]